MKGSKIAVLGHGTVGSGVCEILIDKAKEIEKAAGKALEIGYVIDLKEFNDLSYSDRFVKDFDTVLNDEEVSIVVEAMGGIEPAFSYIKAALEHGKSAVTSNKELVAEKGAKLLETARAHNANFLFEASVGGGIPIIRPLYSAMNASGITEIAGILNGTTNYILTQMYNFGAGYEEALVNAQKLGYAESDPSADVLGFDSKRKIAILSSLCWGNTLKPEEIPTEGIDKITEEDVNLADKNGFAIKLIAMAKRLESEKIFARVSPMLIKKGSPLSSVNDVFNAVLVKAETAGDVLFYGRGAGKLPTASAVISDIIECAKAENNIEAVFWKDGAQSVFAGADSYAQRYLIRYNPIGNADIFDFFEKDPIYFGNPVLGNGFITKPLTESELLILKEKLFTEFEVLSIIPLFE